MLMNEINTNALDSCKAAIMSSSDIQGDFDIAARRFINFIGMTPYLKKNATAKVSSMNRSGGARGGGRGIDCGSGMPAESDFQDAMGSTKNK